MKKLLKFVLITLFCLILIICIGGYIILKNIDLNTYKGQIEKIVADATGRELKIGNIAVKPSFSPIIEISEVTFSNPEWAKEPQMATVKTADISINLIALLHNSYVINKFTIRDAVINLEQKDDNSASWIFETATEPEEAPKEEKTSFNFSLIKNANAEETVALETPKETADNTGDILSKLVIKEVALENVKINYTDKENKTQSYDIKKLYLDENDDDNIDFDFNVNDGLYKGTGFFGALPKLQSNDGYPISANLDIMGIKLDTKTTLYDVDFNAIENLRFTGSVKSTGFMGKDSTYKESAEINLSGNIKLIDAVINSVKLAGNEIKGTTKIDLNAAIPEITANLSSDKINIAPFMENKQSALNLSFIKQAHATTLAPAQVIPYDVLSAINAKININIDSLVNSAAVIAKNLEIETKINNGIANININKGTLANGSVKLNSNLNASKKALNIKADFIKVNLATLLKAFDVQSESFNFTGGSDTDLYLDLNSTGNTYAAIVENLNGKMALIIDKSKLHLGNIGLIKGNIISQLLNTLNITKGNDDLDMACAVVRSDIKDGFAKFPNGIVVNADKFTIVASGDINLKNDKINIGVKPFGGKLTDTNIAKALSSLVKLTGTLQNPGIGVDTANVVKNVVGATMTGPVYLGAQLVMENDDSPCYTALKDTGYETRFPKSSNLTKAATDNVGKALDSSVDMVKDTAKGLLNMFSGKKDKKAKNAQ